MWNPSLPTCSIHPASCPQVPGSSRTTTTLCSHLALPGHVAGHRHLLQGSINPLQQCFIQQDELWVLEMALALGRKLFLQDIARQLLHAARNAARGSTAELHAPSYWCQPNNLSQILFSMDPVTLFNPNNTETAYISRTRSVHEILEAHFASDAGKTLVSMRGFVQMSARSSAFPLLHLGKHAVRFGSTKTSTSHKDNLLHESHGK